MNLYSLWFHRVRRQFLIDALTVSNGNQLAASEKLGIHRNSLNRMLKEDGISRSMIREMRESLPQFDGKSPQVATRYIYRNDQGESHV